MNFHQKKNSPKKSIFLGEKVLKKLGKEWGFTVEGSSLLQSWLLLTCFLGGCFLKHMCGLAGTADAHNIWKSKVKEIWDMGCRGFTQLLQKLGQIQDWQEVGENLKKQNGQLICLSYFTSPFRVETHSLVEHVLHHICVCNEPTGQPRKRIWGNTHLGMIQFL